MLFHDSWALFFIPAIFILAYVVEKRRKTAAFLFSSIELLSGQGPSLKALLSRNMAYFRVVAVSLLLLALARPQSPIKDSIKRTEGIDIILTLDVSTSMLAEDFTIDNKRYSRVDVVKKVVSEFIPDRENDRIAIVVFGARPYTVCPLTLNHSWLVKNLDRIYAGMLEDRTAIGSALASSLNRLKRSKAKDKVVILLTDGRNNAGKITPMTAADIAKALNIRIYTIGAGMMGMVPYPIKNTAGETVGYTSMRIDIDEHLLREIAAKTGGKYFRAIDTASLKKIYEEIDRMEKAPIQEKGYEEYEELFGWFLVPGLVMLLLEAVLSNTILRRIP